MKPRPLRRAAAPWLALLIGLVRAASPAAAQEVAVPAGETVRFDAPLHTAASVTTQTATVALTGRLEVSGTFLLGGNLNATLEVPDPALSLLDLTMGPDRDGHPRGVVAGVVRLSETSGSGAELRLRAEPGWSPPPGSEWVILSGPRTGTFAALDDQTDLGCELRYGADHVTVRTTRPRGTTQVVIDEDWTDGAHSHPGWTGYNPQPTNHRSPAIPQAILRPATLGTWGVSLLDLPSFRAGPDDILIIRLTAFSDVAYDGMERAKPEVALLRGNAKHYWGHDNPAELSVHYSTKSFEHQLRPSVGNDDVQGFGGAFVAGGRTAANLVEADTALGVYRPVGEAQTNVEAFGRLGWQERTFAHGLGPWDNIQISLPGSHKDSKTVYATGTSKETAQVGMSAAHVGVTRRTDANLDYRTDARDFAIWFVNRTRGGGSHLQLGDFNNDQATDAADLALWLAGAGQVHAAYAGPALRFGAGVAPLPGGGAAPALRYHAGTGALELVPGGAPVVALYGLAPVREGAPADAPGWSADVVGEFHWADPSLAGLAAPRVLAALPRGLAASDFPAAWTFLDAAGKVGEVAVDVVAGPGGFAAWAGARGLAADPSSASVDGLPAGLRFFAGPAATRALSAAPAGDPPQLTVTRLAAAAGVAWTLQHRAANGAWTDLPAPPAVWEAVGGGAEAATFAAPAGPGLYRLRLVFD